MSARVTLFTSFGPLNSKCLIASSKSPSVKDPFAKVVLNWVKRTDAAPYVRNVQQSCIDSGITMKITVVLYGPSQLSFGYSVLPGQSGFPHGVAFELGFHNIRNQRETWKFNVPVSRSSMAPQQSFLPMVSITEVQL